MKDQLITFETAKLAKEKGFDGYCFYHFDSEGIIHENSELLNIGCEGGLDTDYHLLSNFSYEILCSPTQALLQKWLREKHNIVISISPHFYGMFEPYMIKYSYKEFVHNDYREFDKYEDCLENGLLEGLNLINI